MKNEIVICDLIEEYIDQMHSLYTEHFTEKWSKISLCEEWKSSHSVMLLALCEERVVGFLVARHILDEGDVDNLAVTAEYRHHKIATKLMEQLFLKAKDAGIKRYTLEVRANNLSAIKFYESVGFVKVGMRKNYYHHPTDDAILYCKEF